MDYLRQQRIERKLGFRGKVSYIFGAVGAGIGGVFGFGGGAVLGGSGGYIVGKKLEGNKRNKLKSIDDRIEIIPID